MANSTKIAIVGLMILLVVVVAKYVKRRIQCYAALGFSHLVWSQVWATYPRDQHYVQPKPHVLVNWSL